VSEDISRLLVRWAAGDAEALAQVMPLVYDELRRLGRSSLRRAADQSLLQPTALVHEAWLRMAGKNRLSLASRGQFYALAAKIMRDILVDEARRRRAAKRGGSRVEISLDGVALSSEPRYVDFLALDDAITRLGRIKARYAQIIELRSLGGLTITEAAAVLSVSHATVEREWKFARAWLRRELEAEGRTPADRARSAP
jgi:RNA polymerase sigma factor (TIGR02999 family)